MSLLLLTLFVVILMLGAPVAVALGLSAAVVIVLYDLPLSVLAQRSVNSLDSTPLLAVPLFILAAHLLNATGINDHLFMLLRRLVGHIRGGIAHVSVLVSLIFSGISGAALADIGALGPIQMRMMREAGYPDRFAAGITAAAATIGPIFPPSIPIIIFAATTNVSAVRLLLAGVLPGLLIAALLMLQLAILARRYDLPRDQLPPAAHPLRPALFASLPALVAPLLLIGGLLSGLFGPTEIAAVAVLYVLLIGHVVYRRLNRAAVWQAARETVEATANVLFIVAAAALFAWVLTVDQIPARATRFLLELSADPLVLLLIVNLLLLVVGTILEPIAAILIIAPIVTPALTLAGVDPLQLGIVFVLNLMIGLLTPPVGLSLYMVVIVSGLPFAAVVRGTAPFLIALLLALLIVTLVPEVATWLPGLMWE